MTYARYTGTVQDDKGKVVSKAKIEVRKESGTFGLASLFSDRAGTVQISNPFESDDLGQFFFHAAGDAYRIRAYSGESVSPDFEVIWRYVPNGTGGEYDIEVIDARARAIVHEEMDDTIAELEADIAGAAAGLVQTESWTALAAISGTTAGRPGRVATTATTTHTDPVVGGTVKDAGEYRWSTSPAGWRRIGDWADATVLRSDYDNHARVHYKNQFLYGDLDGGVLNPIRQANSPIIELTGEQELIDRGYKYAMQWRTGTPPNGSGGSEFFRLNTGVDIRGKYVAGCFLVYAPNFADVEKMTTIQGGAVIWQVNSGSLADPTGPIIDNGWAKVGNNLYLFWRNHQISNPGVAVTDVVIGHTLGTLSAGGRLATGVFLALEDSPINMTTLLAQMQVHIEAKIVQAQAGGISQRKSLLVLNGESTSSANTSSFTTIVNGHKIANRFSWKPLEQLTVRTGVFPVFNPRYLEVDGVVIRDMNDDSGPIFNNGGHILADHGYTAFDATVASHDKTLVDVGSLWSKGGQEYVLHSIINGTTLVMMDSTSNLDPLPTTGAFTHVSGATHTANIVATNVALVLAFPPFMDRQCVVEVDGAPLSEDEDRGTFEADEVVFKESYFGISYADYVTWVITEGATGSLLPTGDPINVYTISHRFNKFGEYTMEHELIALRAGENSIRFVAGTQVQASDTQAIYVPKALPFTHDGVPRDFAMIEDNYHPATTNINFDSAKAEPTGLFLDRALFMGSNGWGMAVGFFPVDDADPAVRRSMVTAEGLAIWTNDKTYFRAWSKNPAQMWNVGDRLGFRMYRNPFKMNDGRTAVVEARSPDCDIITIDWHNVDKIDRVPISGDFIGRRYTIVEMSASVTLLSGGAASDKYMTGDPLFQVTTVGTYGYAMLKFEKD